MAEKSPEERRRDQIRNMRAVSRKPAAPKANTEKPPAAMNLPPAPPKKGTLPESANGVDGTAPEQSAPEAAAPRKAVLVHTTVRAKKNNTRRNLIVGGLVVLLAVCVTLAAVLPGCNPQTGPGTSSAGSDSKNFSTVQDTSYDMAAFSIPEGEYADVLLAETEDMGEQYVQETLFLGDSNTERMLEYSAVTKLNLNNCIGVEGMGISGAIENYCVRFSGVGGAYTMAQAVSILQPRRVVVTFGTNNAGGITADSFIATYSQVIDAIQASYPYADVIIGSIPPISQRHMNEYLSMSYIDNFNMALLELAKEKEVRFLNWSEVLKDPGSGYMKNGYAVDDGVHLTQSGIADMFEYFRTHGLDTEDTRPKPLKTVPSRLPIPRPVVSRQTATTVPSSSSSSSTVSSSSSQPVSSSSEQPVVPSSSEAVPSVPAPAPSVPAPTPSVPAPTPSTPVPTPSVPVPSTPAPVPSEPAPTPDPPAPDPPVPETPATEAAPPPVA